jgi:ribosomal protein L7/L12
MRDPSLWISISILIMVASLLTTLRHGLDRLARVERKLNALLGHFNIDHAPGSSMSDRVRELARDPSKKIEAIRAYREETGARLADAKRAVEDLANSR